MAVKQKILDFVTTKPNRLNSYKFRQMYIEDGFSNEIQLGSVVNEKIGQC